MLPLFFLFTCVDRDSRSASVITEKRIHPAAGAIPTKETVFCRDSAEYVVDYDTECFPAVDSMVNSLIDNNDQHPFFICFT